ncbi:MAG TPA: hypothetical protein VFB92_28195 [Vicinamibacterales bacterium]|jgi:hypothetical protein|nr:hypothetical protein [Vicinamibacterales bacterium]
MYAAYDDYSRSRSDRGPAIYYGYCGRTGRYRMMDLPEYLSNVQQGMSRWMSDTQTMYQDVARGYYGRGQGDVRTRTRHDDGCGCRDCRHDDCHCECCVCDADVLVHARCGELRRIPVTFENDTRRERQVKLELDKFMTSGGRDLGWPAQLSESEFTLRACDDHTVIVSVQVRCEPADTPGTTDTKSNTQTGAAANTRTGSVDRCEVAYAKLRADGCLIRPAVIAVAVLPDDCDAYRRPCSCGCCH